MTETYSHYLMKTDSEKVKEELLELEKYLLTIIAEEIAYAREELKDCPHNSYGQGYEEGRLDALLYIQTQIKDTESVK